MGVTVAALYVDPKGVYSGREDVECWGLPDRDAREYAGPWPVVAHPPCQRWGRLAGFCAVRWGVPVGADDGCFAAALDSVRTWGGVLEHPYPSRAWRVYSLPLPTPYRGWTLPDEHGGQSCVYEQAWSGHAARKPTLLYAVRCALPPLVVDRIDESCVTKRISLDARKGDGKPKQSHREASATPPAFAEILLAMARSATRDAAELCSRRESVGPW